VETGRTLVEPAVAAVCVAGAVVTVATQHSLITTGVLTVVVQPQLVWQKPQASRHVEHVRS